MLLVFSFGVEVNTSFFSESVETFEYFLPLKSLLMSFYSQKITSSLRYSALNDTILIKTNFKKYRISSPKVINL